jgi:hypothetical protein
VAGDARVDFELRVANATGGRVELIMDGRPLAPGTDPDLNGEERTLRFSLRAERGRHWVRANVRGPDGKLWLVGNPIYLEGAPR